LLPPNVDAPRSCEYADLSPHEVMVQDEKDENARFLWAKTRMQPQRGDTSSDLLADCDKVFVCSRSV
jgi:hypothetical protein